MTKKRFMRVATALLALGLVLVMAYSLRRLPSMPPGNGRAVVDDAAVCDVPEPSEGEDAEAPTARKDDAPARKKTAKKDVGSTHAASPEGPQAVAQDEPLDEGVELVAEDEGEDAEASASGEIADPIFVMPPDALYEPQTVLVQVGDDADLSALAESLAGSLGAVEVAEVADGVVRVTYEGGQSVEEAINELLEAGVAEEAQPNYAYTVLSDTELEPSADPDPADADPADPADPDPAATGSTQAQEDDDATVESLEDTDGEDVADEGEPEEDASEGLSEGAGILDEDLIEEEKETVAPDADLDADEGDSLDIADEDLMATEDGADEALAEEDSLSADEGTSVEDLEAVEEVEPEEAGTPQGAEATDEEGKVALEAQAVSVNDPMASKQWALKSIKAYDAWSYAKGNNKVTVATLDLGCQKNHPDLKANIVEPYNAYNALYGGSLSDVSPNTGSMYHHGTHVAGIIGAVSNNGKGVSGVSYNANVMPVKVVDSSGIAYTDVLVNAYDYVISKRKSLNVRVVNLSMGKDGPISSDDTLLKKISEAYAKGIVTVAAAGNRGSSETGEVPYTCYPSDYSKIVSVINLRQNGTGVKRSETSNYNAKGKTGKNISAPGAEILSTGASSEYATLSGTSMAAPVVSGVLALEFAAKPSLTASDAVTLLYATAKNLGGSSWTAGYGWGEVNAAAAAKAARDGMTAAQKKKAAETRNLANTLAASEVTQRINALPAVGKMRLSHASKVSSARAAYNKLTAKQKALVTNLSKLTAAEKRIAELKRDAAVAKGLTYRTHVQQIGWQDWKSNGTTSGTTGRSLRLEGIRIKLESKPFSGNIQYRTHVQTYGWESSWKSGGAMSGTTGQGKRLEAIQIRLSGNMAKHYDVWYRVHAQKFGWMGWATNGASAGSQGYGYRLEGIQIKVVPKGSAAPGSTANAFHRN